MRVTFTSAAVTIRQQVVMTRRSDVPGSYREWAAEQRAADQAEKRAEQQRKAAERDRLAKEAIARDDEAAAKTAAVDRQVATLQGLLRASLSRDPRISLGHVPGDGV